MILELKSSTPTTGNVKIYRKWTESQEKIINQSASSSHVDLQMFHKLAKNSEIQSKHIMRFTNMCECSKEKKNPSAASTINQWAYETFFFFFKCCGWVVLDNKNKMPCELLSYLHHYRTPDDTENTFLNVHLIMPRTVRPQKKMMTAKIGRSHDSPWTF